MDVKSELNQKPPLGRRLLEKLLMPIVATAASAAAGYAAKKGPQLLEENVLPKLRELAEGPAQDLPGRAKAAVAKAARSAQSHNGGRARSVSGDELERRLSERERHRAARRKVAR